jgi:hypothetical protein
VKATILGWSAASGLVLGLIAGLLLFALAVVGGELLVGIVPRLAGRTRTAFAIFSFVLLPLAGAVLGWLEGRLKLQ